MVKNTQEFIGSPLATQQLICERPDIMENIGNGALLLNSILTCSSQGCIDQLPTTFNWGRWIKELPNFSQQMAQGNRDNPIYFKRRLYRANGEQDEGCDQSGVASEGEAMKELQEILSDIRNNEGVHDISLQQMLEGISFIGQREYEEAVFGIANQWKSWLNQGDNHQICPLVGVISRSDSKTYHQMVKSDEYMLERILSNFSDEELRRYSGRLVLNADDLYIDGLPEERQILLIDDWSISGTQMAQAYGVLRKEMRDLAKEIKIQLIVGAEELITAGFEYTSCYRRDSIFLPVHSYYRAHSIPAAEDGAVITGSHSSVDYGFVNEFTDNNNVYINDAILTIPILAAIERPYRLPGVGRGALVKTAALRRYNRELIG